MAIENLLEQARASAATLVGEIFLELDRLQELKARVESALAEEIEQLAADLNFPN